MRFAVVDCKMSRGAFGMASGKPPSARAWRGSPTSPMLELMRGALELDVHLEASRTLSHCALVQTFHGCDASLIGGSLMGDAPLSSLVAPWPAERYNSHWTPDPSSS